MLEFIAENYKIIISLLSLAVTIVLFIISVIRAIKDKKVSDVLKFIPLIINEAESVFKMVPSAGDSKLAYVLNVIKCVCSEAKVKFSSDYYTSIVEGYLSTPSKK